LITKLAGYTFARLSDPANHGWVIVSRSLTYLAAGKRGLTEDELLGLLSLDTLAMGEVGCRFPHEEGAAFPAVLWSMLYFDLKPYLRERAADGTVVLSFFHPQFKEIVGREFLHGPDKQDGHHALALYFGGMATETRESGQKSLNIRKLAEIPYQQRKAKMWLELEKTLCDLDFLQAKCSAGLIDDLLADYDAALADPDLPSTSRPRFEDFARFARAQRHAFSKDASPAPP
jgi:hypothetical protein